MSLFGGLQPRGVTKQRRENDVEGFPRLQSSQTAANFKSVKTLDIEECGGHWRFECPMQWQNLQPLPSSSDEDSPEEDHRSKIRFCDVCESNVYFVETEAELLEHKAQRHCVSFKYKKNIEREDALRTKIAEEVEADIKNDVGVLKTINEDRAAFAKSQWGGISSSLLEKELKYKLYDYYEEQRLKKPLSFDAYQSNPRNSSVAGNWINVFYRVGLAEGDDGPTYSAQPIRLSAKQAPYDAVSHSLQHRLNLHDQFDFGILLKLWPKQELQVAQQEENGKSDFAEAEQEANDEAEFLTIEEVLEKLGCDPDELHKYAGANFLNPYPTGPQSFGRGAYFANQRAQEKRKERAKQFTPDPRASLVKTLNLIQTKWNLSGPGQENSPSCVLLKNGKTKRTNVVTIVPDEDAPAAMMALQLQVFLAERVDLRIRIHSQSVTKKNYRAFSYSARDIDIDGTDVPPAPPVLAVEDEGQSAKSIQTDNRQHTCLPGKEAKEIVWSCPNGHNLLVDCRLQQETYLEQGFICDVCEKYTRECRPGNCWTCMECSYDLCLECHNAKTKAEKMSTQASNQNCSGKKTKKTTPFEDTPPYEDSMSMKAPSLHHFLRHNRDFKNYLEKAGVARPNAGGTDWVHKFYYKSVVEEEKGQGPKYRYKKVNTLRQVEDAAFIYQGPHAQARRILDLVVLTTMYKDACYGMKG